MLIAKKLWAYLGLIFTIQATSIIIPPELVPLYLSVSVFCIGFLAILFRKMVDKKSILDMGFRLNRNSAIGFLLGLFFIGFTVFFAWMLPSSVGLVRIVENVASPLNGMGTNLFTNIAYLIITDGALMFVAALFGEELAFRGYIQPDIETRGGIARSVSISAVIFAVWHLPVYFSLYLGGAATAGWAGIVYALFGHFISVIPLAMLYATTRELYGVSVIHAIFDVIVYEIMSNPMLGEASSYAVFNLLVSDPVGYEIYAQCVQYALILVMLVLCRIARKFLIQIPTTHVDKG